MMNEGIRHLLRWTRRLIRDADGHEVMAGLSPVETEEYLNILNDPDPDLPLEECADRDDRYLELHDRHHAARMIILGAQMEAEAATRH